jgi:hypothetical protein
MTSENGPGYMVPIERIEGAILEIRGQRVMLDADLAAIYGVETKMLVRAVRRNIARFPADFMFQLTDEELGNLRCQFGTSSQWGGRRYPPYAFTEHGAVMVASVLKSRRAVEVSVVVVRAFVRMRRMLADNRQLAVKLAQLESKYDAQFKVVFDAIRKLMEKPRPEPQPPRKIGFHVSETIVPYGVGGKKKKQ